MRQRGLACASIQGAVCTRPERVSPQTPALGKCAAVRSRSCQGIMCQGHRCPTERAHACPWMARSGSRHSTVARELPMPTSIGVFIGSRSSFDSGTPSLRTTRRAVIEEHWIRVCSVSHHFRDSPP
eukprot:scaffold213037_cov32-Tisochrysis_lutea.AAC.2